MNRANYYMIRRQHSNLKSYWRTVLPRVMLPKIDEGGAAEAISEPKEVRPKRHEDVEGPDCLTPVVRPPLPKGLSAYGCVYHVGTQKLSVTVPGDMVPVKFDHDAFLNGIWHEEDTPDVQIKDHGIYEVTYMVCLAGASTAAVAFAVQADGEMMPGSLQSRLLTNEEQVCGGTVIGELWKDSIVRVVMTSGTVVSGEMKGTGVTASLVLKKLS